MGNKWVEIKEKEKKKQKQKQKKAEESSSDIIKCKLEQWSRSLELGFV